MTTLARLEEVLQKKSISYEQLVSGKLLRVKLKSDMPSGLCALVYNLQLAESEHGLLKGSIILNRISAQVVEKVELFCESISSLVPPIKLDFDEQRRQFFLHGLVDPEDFDADAARFIEICDFTHPLFLHVGKTGKWEESIEGLVYIASLPIEGVMQ